LGGGGGGGNFAYSLSLTSLVEGQFAYIQSRVLTYFATDIQFVLALRPSGAHDQILAVDKQLRDDVMGRLPWREEGSVLYQVTVFVCVDNMHVLFYKTTSWYIVLYNVFFRILRYAVQIRTADCAFALNATTLRSLWTRNLVANEIHDSHDYWF